MSNKVEIGPDGTPIVTKSVPTFSVVSDKEAKSLDAIANEKAMIDKEVKAVAPANEPMNKRIESNVKFNQSLGLNGKNVTLSKIERIKLVLKNNGMDSMQQIKALIQIENILNEE